MRSDTPSQLVIEPAQLRPSPAEDATDPPTSSPTPTRRAARRERSAAQRARRGLVVAIVVCAAAPTVVIVALWRNLTEPFWFNEQWRAYYIANSGNWWHALSFDGGPFPAGWYFLERFTGELFGTTELALRLPTAVFLPVGCVLLMLLARRWMPTSAAVVVALLGSLTGALVSYAIQLSEYQLDAAAAVAVVLLHDMLWEADPERWGWTRTSLAYGGIALACIFGTPALYIAGPLLLLDVVRDVRRRLWPRVIGAVGAGLVILVHLKVFVVHQSALRSSSFWDAQFIPHHGFGGQAAFVWDGLRGFVTGAFTITSQGPLAGSGWSWVLTLVFGVLLCVGGVEAARSSRGRALLFAIVASQVLTLVASYTRYWPFGFVRTNYYLIPLLLLVAGIGAVRAVRLGVALFLSRKPGRLGGPLRGILRIGAVALCVFVALGLVLAVLDEVAGYRQIKASISAAAYGKQINDVVDLVQGSARSGAAVVVTGGVMTNPGWRYYGYEYTGKAMQRGHRIPLDRVAYPVTHGSRAITTFVNRLNPSQVFLYIPFGTTGPEIGLDIKAISRGANCSQGWQRGYGVSGLILEFSCTPAA